MIRIIVLFYLFNIAAQCGMAQYLQNPSFEGTETGDHMVPFGWEALDCPNDLLDCPNTPDFHTYYGFYDEFRNPMVEQSPADDSIYTVLKSRNNYYLGGGDSICPVDSTIEKLVNTLERPLLANGCYTFSMMMCYEQSIRMSSNVDWNFAHPLKMQIYAAVDPCGQKELLFESEPVDHEDWREYKFFFETGNEDYHYIILQPFWVDGTTEAYNGSIFVDDLKLISDYRVHSQVMMDTVVNPNSVITLTASQQEEYYWQPQHKVNPISDWEVEVTATENEVFLADNQNLFNCTVEQEVFKINVVDCDTVLGGGMLHVLDTTVRYGSQIVLKASEKGTNYRWKHNNAPYQQITINPQKDTSYSVEVELDYQCLMTETFHVNIELEIPNVITPNQDGKNDFFKIHGLPEKGVELWIYDRNGRLVFNTNNYANDWDGNYDRNGDQLSSETYWYVLKIPGYNEPFRGYVYVAR